MNWKTKEKMQPLLKLAFHLERGLVQDMQYYFPINQWFPIWVTMKMHHEADHQWNCRLILNVQVNHPNQRMNPLRCNQFDFQLNPILLTSLNYVTLEMVLQPTDCDEWIIPIANVPDHRMHSLALRLTDYVRFQCDKVLWSAIQRHTKQLENENWLKFVCELFQKKCCEITGSLQKVRL